MKGTSVSGLWVLAAILIGTVGTAYAVQGAGAIILEFDTSARSAGMGSATTAVFWAEDANIWANPALLGYYRGARYQHFHSQLVPGLAEDIFLDSDRVTLGAYGVGFSLSCWPFGRKAGDFLDLGEQIVTDESGEVIGTTFHSYLKVDSWSVGVSLAQLYDTIRGDAGRADRGLARYGDIAVGYTHKRYEDLLIGNGVLGELEGTSSARATMNDYGLLLRATPYNSIDDAWHVPSLDGLFAPLGGLRLDLSYGWSDLNANDAWLRYVDWDQQDPAPRMRRHGLAVRGALGLPRGLREALDSRGLGLLAESLAPLLSYSLSWDHVTPWVRWDATLEEYVFAENSDEDQHEHLRGGELIVANIFYLRRGHVEQLAGDIDGSTTGWGLGFRLADLAGFRYDKAKVPQATGLPKVEREGYTLCVDGLALWRRLR